MGETKRVVVFEGEAKLGKVVAPTVALTLSPEDLESPLSFQFALTKLMEQLTRALEQPPEPKYMAEVKFKDHMGQPVSIAVDLGKSIPPFSKDKVKARVVVEIYEEDE
ncbi:MAG: hypothetical protein GXO07_06170 [Crenarchaeota archaeon]|nr:hypothetical protein [Thermoproteota archaeon]